MGLAFLSEGKLVDVRRCLTEAEVDVLDGDVGDGVPTHHGDRG
jgi:hypothetical protein